MVTWAQIRSQCLVAIVDRGSSRTLVPREKPWAEQGACALGSCWLSSPLQRNSWYCILTNGTETFPVQSELLSYILICISDQSERLHHVKMHGADQPGPRYLGPIKLRECGRVLIYIKLDQSGTASENFSLYVPVSPSLGEHFGDVSLT